MLDMFIIYYLSETTTRTRNLKNTVGLLLRKQSLQSNTPKRPQSRHSLRRLTYNWISIAVYIVTVELSVHVLQMEY